MSSTLLRAIFVVISFFLYPLAASADFYDKWGTWNGETIHEAVGHHASWRAAAEATCDYYDGWYGSGVYRRYIDLRVKISTDRSGTSNNGRGAWHNGRCEFLQEGTEIWSEYRDYGVGFDKLGDTEPEGDGSASPKPKVCPLTRYPINIITGNKYKLQTDFAGDALSHLNFQRYYNSDGFMGEELGGKWTHNYGAKIVPSTDGLSLVLATHTGKDIYYSLVNDSWVTEAGVQATLTQLGSGGWTFRLVNDQVLQFNATGQLISITHRDGRVETLVYTNNQLTEVQDDLGNNLQFTYFPTGIIQTVTAPNNRTWTYRYDANNNLEFVDNPDGTTRQYFYENTTYPFALTGIADERGVRYANYEYNAGGRAVASYHGPTTTVLTDRINGVTLNYVDSNTTVVTNSRGFDSTYTNVTNPDQRVISGISGAGCANCGTSDSTYEYDPVTGYLTAKVKEGQRTEYSNFDANGNYRTKIIAAGTPEARTINYTYDSRFFSKIATKSGSSVCPGETRLTTYSYDSLGNVIETKIDGFTPSCVPLSRNTNLQYSGPLNQLSQIDGPRSDVSDITTLDYYPNNAIEGFNRARLRSITSGALLLRDNIQYTATGKIQSESRPNGMSVNYTYYPGNDRLETVTQSGDSISRTTRWTYLPTGEVETITIGDGTAQAVTITLGYDAARRLTRITDASGNYMEYILDTEGNRTDENVHDSNGTLKRALAQTFDAYDRIETVTQANESSEYNYGPNSNLDNTLDGNLTTTDYSYDALKRLVGRTQDLGGTNPSTENALTQYDYDTQDNLTEVVDPVNGTTTYVYDDLGNLLTQTSPDTGTSAFVFDAAGNVLTRSDAKGQSFSYTYDALNRVTAVNTPNSLDNISYIYDTCSNGVGQLCSVTQGNETTNYSYNAFGDVIQHQGIGYGYDELGRLVDITYPSGDLVTYLYNVNGQIDRVDAVIGGVPQTLASNIAYAPFGPVTSLTYGNGTQLTETFDQAYRMTGQSIPGIYQRDYTQYDGNGNLKLISKPLLGGSDSYGYDSLNRIDTASGLFGSQSFGYDKNGNRTMLLENGSTPNYTYEPNSNRLTGVGGWTYGYDANGNIVSKQDSNGNGLSYTHNAHNRLTNIEGLSDTAMYGYNALGQRVTKQVGSDLTEFSYNLSGQLMYEKTGDVIKQYIYLNGIPLAITEGSPPQQTAPFSMSIDNDDFGSSYEGDWSQDEVYEYDPATGDWIYNIVHESTDEYNDIFQWSVGALPAGQYIVSAKNHSLVYTDSDNYNDNASHAALYRIFSNSQTQEIEVFSELREEYESNFNSWFTIGTFSFSGDGTEFVQLSNDLGYSVTADVVRFDLIPSSTSSSAIRYIHTDHLGTPRAVSDENQNVIWRWEGDPFGATAANDDPDGDGTAFILNLRFPGQYYDAESGLHYNYFRYYDPSTGRYITSDPIGLQGGLNTYGYVGGNPLYWIDPFGLEVCVLTTRNSWGGGTHSAIWGSSSKYGPFLYDPSGSFSDKFPGTGNSDLIEGKDANKDDFAKHHKDLDGESTEMQCKNTTPEEDEKVRKAAEDAGGGSGPNCALKTSEAIRNSGVFPNFNGSVLPGNVNLPNPASSQKSKRK